VVVGRVKVKWRRVNSGGGGFIAFAVFWRQPSRSCRLSELAANKVDIKVLSVTSQGKQSRASCNPTSENGIWARNEDEWHLRVSPNSSKRRLKLRRQRHAGNIIHFHFVPSSHFLLRDWEFFQKEFAKRLTMHSLIQRKCS